MMNKIVIIGGGHVGITLLHTLISKLQNISLVLIDNNVDKCQSEIEDLYHSLYPSAFNLKLGDYSDCNDAKIIVIVAGISPQKTRNIFLKESYVMIKDIMEKINNTTFSGNIIVLSNPNDVLTTYVTLNYQYPNKVIGSGTMLDNYRMKYYLAKRFNLSPNSIKVSIIGEHGISQVVKWNEFLIENKKINELCSEEELMFFERKVRDISYEIVKAKGYTNFGISSCCLRLIEILLNNEQCELIVSSYNLEYNVAYSRKVMIKNGDILEMNLDNNVCDNKLFLSINKIKGEYDTFIQSKIIGFDLDDTITDLREAMHAEAEKFDSLINGDGIVDSTKYLVGEKYNWSDENKELFFKKYRINAINKAKVRKNVIKVLKKLREYGYKIVIITARNSKYYSNPYDDTKNWLIKHHIPFDKLIVEAGDKKTICLREKVNVFVDDMPKNCEEVAKDTNIKVYMMDNIDNISNCSQVVKVRDFLELYEVIINE